MRKPRDYDAELKALDDKARQLKQRRIVQLGQLVVACGADGLSPEQLAGALLGLKEMDAKTVEGWRQRGAAFFQRASRKPGDRNGRVHGGPSSDNSGTPSA